MPNPVVVEKTTLDGVLLLSPSTASEDFRGSYVELYNVELYKAAGIAVDFVQDDVSTSRRHVLRGIHGDRVTTKMISCPYGAFYVVVVDCNEKSSTFGKWYSTTLSASNHKQLLVPPNHGLAHLILSDVALFHYKQSTYYDRASQFTHRWDDPRFNIYWPVKDPLLSERDALAEY